MKHKKIRLLLGILVLLIVAFFAREVWLGREQPARIFGVSEAMLVRTPEGELFRYGQADSPEISQILYGIHPFLLGKKITPLFDQEVGTEIAGPTFTVQVLSPHLARGLFANELGGRRSSLFFFREGFDEGELELIKIHRTRLHSDWWVMTRNMRPEFLPLPRKGILFLGDRTPSKKTQEFAAENKLALISVAETEGFELQFTGEEWQLQTRE